MITLFNTYSTSQRFGAWRARLSLIFATIALAGYSVTSASAQTTEMMKFVYRLTGPGISPDSAFAKPMTLYRVGEKYSRMEYPPDPDNKTQIVAITREPEAWAVNLANRTAEHMMDPGPTFIARSPILGVPRPGVKLDADDFFSQLEFGSEATFFQQNHATELGARKIDGKDAKGSTIKNGAREVTLFLDAQTEKPLQIDVSKDGKLEVSIHYLSYETGLKFDPALFEIPEGLKVTEKKESK